jgi:hypothetical protein
VRTTSFEGHGHPHTGVALTHSITEARHRLADMLLLIDPNERQVGRRQR